MGNVRILCFYDIKNKNPYISIFSVLFHLGAVLVYKRKKTVPYGMGTVNILDHQLNCV
jgi:hypothetical protein